MRLVELYGERGATRGRGARRALAARGGRGRRCARPGDARRADPRRGRRRCRGGEVDRALGRGGRSARPARRRRGVSRASPARRPRCSRCSRARRSRAMPMRPGSSRAWPRPPAASDADGAAEVAAARRPTAGTRPRSTRSATRYASGTGVAAGPRPGADLVREIGGPGLCGRLRRRSDFVYQTGSGADASPTEAAKWFRLAAEQKRPAAMNQLGVLYAQGSAPRPGDRRADRPSTRPAAASTSRMRRSSSRGSRPWRAQNNDRQRGRVVSPRDRRRLRARVREPREDDRGGARHRRRSGRSAAPLPARSRARQTRSR